MKNFVKKFLNSPIIILLCFVFVFFGIPALARRSQINEFSVAVGVGIDLSSEPDSEYEISFLCFVPIPDQTFTETYNVFSAKGDSVAEAVNEVGLYLGRRLRFAHIKTIVLSEDVLSENVSKLLDFFVRENDIASSTKIVTTNAKAKDFLRVAKEVDSKGSTKISEIVSFNTKDLYAIGTTLESFFEGYFGPCGACTVPYFEVLESETEGLSASTQQISSKNSNEQQNDSTKGKKISNRSNAYVLKKGVKVGFMNDDDTRNLNLILANFKTGFFTIKNIEGDTFNNSNISFEIFEQKNTKKVFFENGIPVVNIAMEIGVEVTEIENDFGVVEKNVQFSSLSEKELEFIETEIKGFIADSLAFQRSIKTDLSQFYPIIYNTDKAKFEKFLSDLDDNDFYLDNIIVMADIKLKAR